MGLQSNASVGEVINQGFYVVARVEADERVAHHAPVVQVPLDAMLKAIGARNLAQNGNQKAKALRAAARVKLEAAAVLYGLKAAAAHEGRNADEYQRLFPKAPSSFSTLSERDLPDAANLLCQRIADPRTDKELAKGGAAVVTATKGYLQSSEVAKKAELALEEAQKVVWKAKINCLEAHSKMKGLLAVAFPRQSKLQASFYPAAKKKAKGAEVQVVPERAEKPAAEPPETGE